MIKNGIIGLSLIIACVSLTLHFIGNKGVKYVETSKLYNEFLLAKELNQKFETTVKSRKPANEVLLNKLKEETQALRLKPNRSLEEIARVAKIEEEYLFKEQQIEKENQQLSAEYDAKIWNQLNQYVKEYGEEKGFEIILGATGQGNIMHAVKKLDITEEVIKYANNRYEGKK